jgi:hypothetical protein
MSRRSIPRFEEPALTDQHHTAWGSPSWIPTGVTFDLLTCRSRIPRTVLGRTAVPRRKALPHVGVAGRRPNPNPCRNWDHGSVSSPRKIRNKASTSTSLLTRYIWQGSIRRVEDNGGAVRAPVVEPEHGNASSDHGCRAGQRTCGHANIRLMVKGVTRATGMFNGTYRLRKMQIRV